MRRLSLSLLLSVSCLAAVAAEPPSKPAPVPIDAKKMAAVNSFERGMHLLDIATSEKEKEEATRLITGAAETGYPDAQFFLGLVMEGPNPVQAREWFTKAAGAGHVRAAVKAATMYEQGKGGEADKEQALKWHRVAAEGGISESAFKVAKAKEATGGANPAETIKMYQKAAAAGDSEANMRLGDLFFTGDGGERNLFEAFKYYRNAAQLKNPKAYFKMGYCYERGHGVGQSNQDAVYWYQKGVDAGDLNCIANMARFYENGVTVEKDPVKAAQLYQIAAEQGEAFSQLSLGSLYRTGSGVKKDMVEAYRWISLASTRGFGKEILVLLEKEMTPDQLNEAKSRAANPGTPAKK
jgi:TPR repeat protein